MKKLSGKMRLSILVSALWFVGVFLALIPHGYNRYFFDDLMFCFFLAIIPLLVCWGTWWVIQGFKNK